MKIDMKVLAVEKTHGFGDDTFIDTYYYWRTWRETYRGKRPSGEGFIRIMARVNRYGVQYLHRYCTCPNYHFHGECTHLPVALRLFEEILKQERGN